MDDPPIPGSTSVAQSQQPDTADMLSELRRINQHLSKTTSFKRNVAMAFTKGMATALGAAVFAGIIVTVLYNLYISSLGTLPFLENVLPQSAVEQYVNPPAQFPR